MYREAGPIYQTKSTDLMEAMNYLMFGGQEVYIKGSGGIRVIREEDKYERITVQTPSGEDIVHRLLGATA